MNIHCCVPVPRLVLGAVRETEAGIVSGFEELLVHSQGNKA